MSRGCAATSPDASVSVSGKTGRMYSGHTLESFVAAMSDFSPLAIGMNCSDAPERINPYVRRLATFSSFPLIYYPNAGHPDETGNYGVTPQMFAESLGPLLADRLLNIVGGCCGTTTAHIRICAIPVKSTNRSVTSSMLTTASVTLIFFNIVRKYYVSKISNY